MVIAVSIQNLKMKYRFCLCIEGKFHSPRNTKAGHGKGAGKIYKEVHFYFGQSYLR